MFRFKRYWYLMLWCRCVAGMLLRTKLLGAPVRALAVHVRAYRLSNCSKRRSTVQQNNNASLFTSTVIMTTTNNSTREHSNVNSFHNVLCIGPHTGYSMWIFCHLPPPTPFSLFSLLRQVWCKRTFFVLSSAFSSGWSKQRYVVLSSPSSFFRTLGHFALSLLLSLRLLLSFNQICLQTFQQVSFVAGRWP